MFDAAALQQLTTGVLSTLVAAAKTLKHQLEAQARHKSNTWRICWLSVPV